MVVENLSFIAPHQHNTFGAKFTNMDADLFFQLVGLIIAVGTFIIAIMALRHKFKTEEQLQSKEKIKEAESHAERMKKIEEEIASLNAQTELLRNERAKIVREIYDEIKSLRSKHDNDVGMVQNQIKEMIKEIKDKNESDHKELKGILESINLSLNTVCTRFSDHVGDNNVNHETPVKPAIRRARK